MLGGVTLRTSTVGALIFFSVLGCDSGSPPEAQPSEPAAEQRPDRVGAEVFGGDRRLGLLRKLDEWTVDIYDDSEQLLFTVDQTTGNLCATSVVYFATADCTGQMYAQTGLLVDECLQAPPPIRRKVTAYPSLGTCFAAAKTALIPVGEPVVVPRIYARADWDPGSPACYEHDRPPEWDESPPQHCVIPLEETTLLPLTFPVPITTK